MNLITKNKDDNAIRLKSPNKITSYFKVKLTTAVQQGVTYLPAILIQY